MSKIIKINITSIICTVLVAMALSLSIWFSTCENTRNLEIQRNHAKLLTTNSIETRVDTNSFK